MVTKSYGTSTRAQALTLLAQGVPQAEVVKTTTMSLSSVKVVKAYAVSRGFVCAPGNMILDEHISGASTENGPKRSVSTAVEHSEEDETTSGPPAKKAKKTPVEKTPTKEAAIKSADAETDEQSVDEDVTPKPKTKRVRKPAVRKTPAKPRGKMSAKSQVKAESDSEDEIVKAEGISDQNDNKTEGASGNLAIIREEASGEIEVEAGTPKPVAGGIPYHLPSGPEAIDQQSGSGLSDNDA
ncbi:MAG: hypothetical protein M1814_003047 [Vezdaea aestivalis]|nr:MAG: hypothetical protein M1814_003047 [Vezdaea aestivalis]